MKCDRCGREATIEEVTKVGQTYVYKHLCEACAAGEGLSAGSASGAATKTTVITVKTRPAAGPQAPAECPRCGLSFGQFRETGRLGCPSCYEAFVSRLGPMIERAQEGGTSHIGKTPKRLLASVTGEGVDRVRAIERVLGESKQRLEKLEHLGRQLRAALAGERFEQAALIRDEMRRIRESVSGGDDASADEPSGSREAGRGDH